MNEEDQARKYLRSSAFGLPISEEEIEITINKAWDRMTHKCCCCGHRIKTVNLRRYLEKGNICDSCNARVNSILLP